MERRLFILIATVFALTSCGTASYTSSSGHRFEDGIYYRPEPVDKEKALASAQKTDALVQKTRESEIYLSTNILDGNRSDTLLIPENKSAVINFSGTGTTVTVTDDPFDQTYFNSYWAYYRPVTFYSPYWDPWYYGRYWGYYDPWYWGTGLYSPWYTGVGIFIDAWFYDPWYWGPGYRPWYPHYCGWYGGWGGPGLGWHGTGSVHGGHGRDVIHTPRYKTGFTRPASSGRPRSTVSSSAGRIVSSGTKSPSGNRTGIARSSSTSRRVSATSGGGSRNSVTSTRSYSYSQGRRASGMRTGIVATERPATKPVTGGNTGTAYSGGRRSVQSYRGTAARSSAAAARQSSYRRPSSSYTRSSGTASYNGYNRSSSFGNRGYSGADFNSSGSYSRSSSSSFNRSSSYSRSSSMSRSSSSFSRSSGYSGGGTGRSSGGSGGSTARRR